MARSNLEKAVERQAGNLDPARKELVMAQFRVFDRNRRRMSDLDDRMKIVDATPAEDPKERKALAAERKQLASERHQLVTENTSISSKLLQHLKGTEKTDDDFDQFMKG